jgi:hypothetical protein
LLPRREQQRQHAEDDRPGERDPPPPTDAPHHLSKIEFHP